MTLLTIFEFSCGDWIVGYHTPVEGTKRMRLILQRVASAAVSVAGEEVAAIGSGMLVLVGIEKGDRPAQVERAADKLAHLRIFEDNEGRMNRDVSAIDGSILLVSQFTLAGSLAKGRRPSFDRAAPAGDAEPLVQSLAAALRERGIPVETGAFGAHMAVRLVNDGPVTFVLDVPVCGSPSDS
jgi:D-tyrosyl-tRNA(Tyr) deacylase